MTLETRRAGVCALVLDGLPDRAIAAALGVAHRTVRDDVRALRRRFEAQSRGELARLLGALLRAERVARAPEGQA